MSNAKRPVLVLRDADSGEVVGKMDLPNFYGKKIHLDIDVMSDDRVSVIPVGWFEYHLWSEYLTNRIIRLGKIGSTIAEAMKRDSFQALHWVEPNKEKEAGSHVVHQ